MDPGEKLSEPDNNNIEDPNLVILKKGQMVYNICRILHILSQDSPPVKNEIADPSVMLIKEIVQFLKLLETILGESNIDLAIQVFKTLTEFVKDSPVVQVRKFFPYFPSLTNGCRWQWWIHLSLSQLTIYWTTRALKAMNLTSTKLRWSIWKCVLLLTIFGKA